MLDAYFLLRESFEIINIQIWVRKKKTKGNISTTKQKENTIFKLFFLSQLLCRQEPKLLH